ncbi:class I SAM-dependent methyltransferase [Haloferula sp.]|uniref:class I SAM-dependent methyltransferase n=1 Tax=Haloferula sp. TaxID=2497595 RepID=UPI003C720328
MRKRPFSKPWGTSGKLLRNGFLVRAIGEEDHGLIQDFMRDYWASPHSDEFFDNFEHRFETVFLRHHAGILEEISKVVQEFGVETPRLVEVGVGDGRVLSYLESKLDLIGEFHGVDINAEQIESNREKFRQNPKLHFWNEDALHWLIRRPAAGTVLLTNGGVLEYFTRDQILGLFEELKRGNQPCAVAVTETLAIDHDLNGEPASFPYGHELSFSHNYKALFEESGFVIRFSKDRFTIEGEEHHPTRWCQFLATVDES